MASQHASERFVKIKCCGCWGYHRSLFLQQKKLKANRSQSKSSLTEKKSHSKEVSHESIVFTSCSCSFWGKSHTKASLSQVEASGFDNGSGNKLFCWFFRSASERRVLLEVEVCYTAIHLHMFTSSSHLHNIFITASHLLIFTSSSSSHLLTFTSSISLSLIFSSSHLLIYSSTHLLIFSSSHLLISLSSLISPLSSLLSHLSSLLISLSSFLSPHFSLLISLSSFLSPHFSLLISLSSFLSPHFSLLISLSSLLSSLFSPLSRSLLPSVTVSLLLFIFLLRLQAVPTRPTKSPPFRTKWSLNVKTGGKVAIWKCFAQNQTYPSETY